MLIDLSHASAPTSLQADICIIGAGAAGITLARGLARHGYRILLLESGGLDHDPFSAALGVGDNIGMAYYQLAESRLRFFGGTTNIWGGRCAPLDNIDFERRPWVPHSGWPINRSELAAGYAAAQQDLGLGPFEQNKPGDNSQHQPAASPDPATGQPVTAGPENSEMLLSPHSLPLDPGRFVLGWWRFDTLRERFSRQRAQDLLRHPRVQVVIHATAVRLQANRDGTRMEHVLLRNPAGRDAVAQASTYVLACGGIKNARLLLDSNDVHPQGLGNRHGQVGRFFMEHPHGRLGHIETEDPYRIWSALRMRFPTGEAPRAPVLRPAPEWQRLHSTLNTVLTCKWQRKPADGVHAGKRAYNALRSQLAPVRRNRALWHTYRALRRSHEKYTRTLATRLLMRRADHQLSVMIRAEQSPNPDSRVLLGKELDPLGCRKANLDWRLNDLDKHSLRELAGALDAELRRLNLGTFIPEPWLHDGTPNWPVDPTVGNHPIGGYHHMGTTRMSSDPTQGVTDANCAVHDCPNLHIAGSSLFPTGGWANPTLTILALAHRLSHHLAAVTPKGGAP